VFFSHRLLVHVFHVDRARLFVSELRPQTSHRRYMSMESRGEVILTGEAEELGYLSQCHVTHKKIQYGLTWARVRASGLEAGDQQPEPWHGLDFLGVYIKTEVVRTCSRQANNCMQHFSYSSCLCRPPLWSSG
jgi:hypothetical protein